MIVVPAITLEGVANGARRRGAEGSAEKFAGCS